jgi:hypothetical protein
VTVNRIVIPGSLVIRGKATAASIIPPPHCLADDAIADDADIDADKMRHLHYLEEYFADPSTAVPMPVHVADAAGTIIDVRALMTTPPTGDKVVAVDVQVGNASTAYATALATAKQLDVDKVAGYPCPAAIQSRDLAAGDSIVISPTVSGSTGSAGSGLFVQIWIEEKP